MPPDQPGKILVPRWVQLVGLPLAIVGVWLLVSAVNHAVFVFVVAALIAILLNPIVRAFCALRIPAGSPCCSSTCSSPRRRSASA